MQYCIELKYIDIRRIIYHFIRMLRKSTESSGMRTQREFLIRMNRGLQSSKRPSKIS